MRVSAKRHPGQVAIIMTLALPVLLAALALCCDTAVMYVNWQQMQKAADAAALAGATYLALDTTEAKQEAHDYALRNGLTDGEITAIYSDAADTPPRWLTVTASRTVPHFFARVVGIMSAPISVSSTAAIQPVTKAKGLVPIGVNCASGLVTQCFAPGASIDLKMSMNGPGNWFPVQLDAPGGNSYRTDIINGSANQIGIGDWINTETGNLIGPTQQGFNTRWQEAQQMDPTGSYASHVIDNPLVIEVPLVDWSNVNGKSQVKVSGFGEFWITGVQGAGQVTGEFLQAGVVPKNTPDPNAVDNGVYTAVLIR
jgi:Flp pilus assembly protein TadG